MLVKVRYADDSCGTVDNSIIDRLVMTNQIREILRSTGWVQVGSERARQMREDRRRNGGTRRRSGSLINIYV